MRAILFGGCVAFVSLLVGLAPDNAGRCLVTLRIVDVDSGREMPGLVRVRDAKGELIKPAELLPRGLGLEEKEPIAEWFVLPKTTVIELPTTAATIEAIAGLEHEGARQALELKGHAKADVALPLKRFSDLGAKGWRSGNTHIHLMKLTRAQADRYLTEVPKADGLDAVFVSYLERVVADQEYISNRYTRTDLAAFDRATGVRFGNGEEHRNNFDGFGEGYGHVMLLDIKELIQPVSIGPGIMKAGTDGIPLARGINQAIKDGATIIWCHNRWGVEATPNFLLGRVSALNINDGGPHGSFKDSFYRLWNAGVPITYSTGTDWFIYDFSRVYADLDGDVTIAKWLEALRGGRTFVTNGPLLRFSVNGAKPGGATSVKPGKSVLVEAVASGRTDFRRLELVRNGKVASEAKTEAVGGHFEARISLQIDVDGPCWLAARTPPPAVKDDHDLTEKAALNEFGKEIFAHTTPVSVEVNGKRFVDPKVCRELHDEMEAAMQTVTKHGKFADASERERVLDVYREAIEAWGKRKRE